LTLKAIVEEHGAVAGASLGKRPNHELPDLWRLFVTIAAVLGNDCSTPDFAAVKACIDELVTVDARSTAFRYADRNGAAYALLPGVDGGLDLIRLHDVMNGIENFFESADLEFYHQGGLRSET
jgi:hypothetical protein